MMFRTIDLALHGGMDGAMCALMNFSQWRLRRHAVTRERLEEYLAACDGQDPAWYYAMPEENRSLLHPEWQPGRKHLSWNSPLQNGNPENHKAKALHFKTDNPENRPTMILLHALMSASDLGYRRIAARFNSRGWNVLFPHLPYHYSRRRKGYPNGSLAITSDLIRNAETLRQSVIELRQLIGWCRQNGSDRIGILGTSYGAWVGAITLSLEAVDFAILLQPVADVGHATFGSPASRVMASILRKNGIGRDSISRHSRLSSPLHMRVRTPSGRIAVIAGAYDRLSPPDSLRTLCSVWGGTRYLEVNQGHFGYRAMNLALKESEHYL